MTFPVDDTTLDLLDSALRPGPGSTRTSVYDLLDMLSTGAAKDEEPTHYHPHDVMTALLDEVRRLRSETTGRER